MNNKYEQDLLKLNTIKEQYKRISSEVLSDSKEYSKYLSDSKIWNRHPSLSRFSEEIRSKIATLEQQQIELNYEFELSFTEQLKKIENHIENTKNQSTGK